MNPDKLLKILLDFNKEISMLILKILPIEINESWFSGKLNSLQVTPPSLVPGPSLPSLFFSLALCL